MFEETSNGSLDGHESTVEHVRVVCGSPFSKTRLKQPRLVVRAV